MSRTLSGRGRVILVGVVVAGLTLALSATAFASDWESVGRADVMGASQSVQFVDALHGWLSADGPYWTDDGGRTWHAGQIEYTGYTWGDTMFVDAQHGWCVGSDRIASSSDGGRTWTARKLNGLALGTYESVSHVWFADLQHGWIGGDFGIAHTTDGGAHWTVQKSGYEFGNFPTAIRFSDTLHGCAVTAAGVLLTTTDGGVHWHKRSIPFEGELTSIAFLDKTHALIGGNTLSYVRIDSTQPAQLAGPLLAAGAYVSVVDANHRWITGLTQVWSTSDAGKTWTPHDPHLLQPITGIFFADTVHGWVIGSAGGLASTSDGGAHWTVLRNGTADMYYAPQFVDATHGFLISSSYTWGVDGLAPGTSALWGTSDAGQHWERLLGGVLFNGYPQFQIFDAVSPAEDWATDYPVAFSFADKNVGFAACISGGVYFTSDGGRSWVQRSSLDAHSNFGLASLKCIDSTHVWALTRGGGVYATADGALSWVTQRVGALEDYSYPSGSIQFADDQHGSAELGDGTLLYTGNGGATWTTASAPTGTTPLTMAVGDAVHAWIGQRDKPLLFSGDGGASWAWSSSPATSGVSAASFSDGLHGRIMSSSSDVSGAWYTADGGSTWTTETADPIMRIAQELTMPDPMHAWAVGAYATVLRHRPVEPLTNLEPYPTSWVSHPVEVSLTATSGADGAAIVSTTYRLGAGSDAPYAAPISVSAEGTTPIEYWSLDASGNAEAAETALVRIDTTQPDVTIDPSGSPYLGVATPRVTAVDALSGVDFVESWFDSDAPGTFSAAEEWDAGVHTIHVRAVDNAGNERLASATFTVLPPHRCSLTKPKAPSTAAAGGRFKISGRIVPGHLSPVSVVIERLKNGGWRRYSTLHATTNAAGTWSVRVKLPRGSFRTRAVAGRQRTWASASSAWRYTRVR